MGADRRSGFMLLEVLVAAVVAVVLITLLTRVAGDNARRAETVRAMSGAMAVARSVLEEASARNVLAAGERRGQAGVYGWVVVTENLGEVIPAPTLSGADQEGNTAKAREAERPKWRLFRVGVAVAAPDGRRTSLETHRVAPIDGGGGGTP